VTVLDIIQRSTEFLERKGVESPRLQSELILAHALRLPRLQLYLNFERSLSPAEVDAMREMVKRRGQREPLQHILGTASFLGLEIKVNARVLIPRPETELLAERALAFLAGFEAGPSLPEASGPVVFDYGTGSGCLAIALAVKCPVAKVVAGDISDEALDLARANAARHGVSGRTEFISSDGFSGVPPGVDFDLVVANPPYIASAEIATLQPEVRDYDPRLALDGGADGLNFYRRLAVEGLEYLRPRGRLMVEFGEGQAGAIGQLLHAHNWVVESVERDYNQQERILVARRQGPAPPVVAEKK
jgi:release factor glutamine methyltransferase